VLWGAFALFFVLIIGVALWGRWSVRRAFPQTEGTIQVPGLDGQVEVIRDEFGVPHIYADTPHDLFMAQGFVHSQDRFFQMDFWRHISHGTLSEMFGDSQVDTDTFIRTLDWGGLAQRQYDADSPDLRGILDSYAAGVNAYIAKTPQKDLSFEYTILSLINGGYNVEPWTGAQSLAWGKVMSWDLGGNLGAEIERAMALATMSPERVRQLAPRYPDDRHPVIVGNSTAEAYGAEASYAVPEGAIEPLADTYRSIAGLNHLTGGEVDTGIGSNSWAVSGARSPTGNAILANDPHLGMQMPSIWYQVGLHCRVVNDECPYDVAGFSFAGVPGVIIGHNANIAWGFTNLGPDVQDLYIEKVNPDNEFQYEYMGEWLDMDLRTEVIDVAGGDSVEVTVRSTIHGPIISGSYGPLDTVGESGLDLPEPYAVALRWTGLDDIPSIAGPIHRINTARNFEEFQEAARLFRVPSQNLLYADITGSIGYQTPGNIPIRANGDGTLPVPGWTDEYEWTGFIPFEELPSVMNPPSGFIVTANNEVVDDSYPYLLTEDWAYGYRARRIVDMLEAYPSAGIADFAAMQFDSRDLNAEFLRPFVLSAVEGSAPAAGSEADAVAALASWDLQDAVDSTGAAIWQATWAEILARTFNDELHEDFPASGGSRWFEVVRGIADLPNDLFWDDVTTDGKETRDDILADAFSAAVSMLEDRFGGDVDDWAWGDLHTVRFTSASLGSTGIGLIDDRFNRGPYPVAGSESVVDAVGWNADEGFEVDWLPSMRMIVDLGNLANSLTIHTTGQSGHIDHPHYDDMIPLWLDGRYASMLWSRSDIEAQAESTLILTP